MKWLAVALLSASLCACSSKGGLPGGDGALCGLDAPDAGVDGTVRKNYMTILHAHTNGDRGTGFSWTLLAPDGGAVQYIAYPEGFHANAEITFVAFDTGTYTATVVATNACGTSDPTTLRIPVPNAAPTAVASAETPVEKKTPAGLSAHQSSDPDFDTLTYRWTELSAPAGSTATIADPTAEQTTFTPDIEGDYQFGLVVNDGTVDSAPVTVALTATNLPPDISAGPDRAAVIGVPVTLLGHGTDPDQDTIAFHWSLVSAPPGSTATLASPDQPSPSFVPDREGAYAFSLSAHDTSATVGPSSMTVTAYRPIAPLSTDVAAARFDAARDQIVYFSSSGSVLRLYSPATQTESTISLGAAPTALALSTDGKQVAVGHDAGFSIVDLTQGDAGTPIALPISVGSIAIDATEVYAFSADQSWNIETYHRATGTTSASTSIVTWGTHAWLHPGGTTLYGIEGSTPTRYTLDKNKNAQFGFYPSQFGTPGYGDLWLVNDGGTLLTDMGDLFSLNPAATSNSGDLLFQGALPGYPYSTSYPMLTWADYGGPVDELAVIPTSYTSNLSGVDDTYVQRFAGTGYALKSNVQLPSFVQAGVATPAHGKFAFYSADGGTLYVIVEEDVPYGAPPGAFGVVTY